LECVIVIPVIVVRGEFWKNNFFDILHHCFHLHGILLVYSFLQEAAIPITKLSWSHCGLVNSFSLGTKKKSPWAMAEGGGVGCFQVAWLSYMLNIPVQSRKKLFTSTMFPYKEWWWCTSVQRQHSENVMEGEVRSLNALTNECVQFLRFSRKPRLTFLSMTP